MSTLNRGRDRVKVRVTRLRGLAKASRRVGTASQLDGRVRSGFSCVWMGLCAVERVEQGLV